MSDTTQMFEALMDRALAAGRDARQIAAPNPWVGALLVTEDGSEAFVGATEAPGERHAEIVAIEAAGERARGGTLVVTLEPCSHHGRTAPCCDAIEAAGVARVVVALSDPDPKVDGEGISRLRAAGIDVVEGIREHEAADQLAAYLHHRRTGRPLVVLKLAATLDGRTAAPDGTSKWITGPEARQDVQRLRADSDAIAVGAGTIRADDPELTARTDPPPHRQPLRVVLGEIPDGARVHPARSLTGPLPEMLDTLGAEGILQLLVEGGAAVAHAFVDAGLVDRFVVYLAPGIMGGDDGAPLFRGAGSATIEDLWRGRFVSVVRLGEDLRLEVAG
jgi:diaminohydroxyphosphoribosylaminopyrimidine deaminase/5-amino-6-(5-phosphoribosylamino)uracil reductase